MGYFAAFNYRMWVKAGTTASLNPTNRTGFTELVNGSNFSLQGSTDSQQVVDYGSSFGFKTQLVTGNSYSIPVTMNLDVTSAGYQACKAAYKDATAGATLQWWRETPVTDGSSSSYPEVHTGVAQVSDFSEDVQAGNIASVSFTLTGYGSYVFVKQGLSGVVTAVTTSGGSVGSGLTNATYTGIALYGGSGVGATATFVVGSGAVTSVTLVAGGRGYVNGEILAPLLASIGGTGTAPTVVATV